MLYNKISLYILNNKYPFISSLTDIFLGLNEARVLCVLYYSITDPDINTKSVTEPLKRISS